MRRRLAPFPRSVAAAQEVLALRGITSPEGIALEDIAADLGIKVRRAAIGNAEGRLVRSGRHGVVTIDEGAFASEKWRFVLAHEIGHFLLHVMRFDLACFPKRSASRDEKSRSFLDEEAASGFGVELLQPRVMVVARYVLTASPMERARALAATFGVSLTTAALRVLDFTEEPCAVVYSEGGTVPWCTATRAFGVNVPNGLRTRCDADGERVVEAAAWGHANAGIAEVSEATVTLAPFDAALTMVWHADQAREAMAPREPRVSLT